MERQQRRAQSDRGFTLVELLVVMVVVGLLAAIAVPAFLNQKRKAYEVSAKSDVEAIAREVASFYVAGSGPLVLRAATSPPADWELADGGSTVVTTGQLSPGNTVGATSAITSDSSYCVAVVPSAAGARTWKATQDGLFVGSCP